MRIQALEPSSFQLYFVNKLPSKMFTGNKITDVESQPLRIAVEDSGGDLESPISSSVKIEIVVLDGDFPAGDKEDWTAEEFNANIVKECSGRRPLLKKKIEVRRKGKKEKEERKKIIAGDRRRWPVLTAARDWLKKK